MLAFSTPYNVNGLIKDAIRSENEFVILFEHEEYVLLLEEADFIGLCYIFFYF
jgi:pyruvate/2-oxoglutarate/acetoin dehydrogenase E1 component